MTALLNTAHTLSGQRSWPASLSLAFSSRHGKSVLSKRQHQGPLRIQRVFYPEGPEVAHTLILHPPGGIVAGDELCLEASVDQGSHGLITTPSAGRVYRNDERQSTPQVQRIHLAVKQDATLEWLPQENIVFSGAHAHNHTQVHLKPSSHYVGWDITCLGRPAANEGFSRGYCEQRLDIYIDERLALKERLYLDGDDHILTSSAGLQGFSCFATMVCYGSDQSATELDTLLSTIRTLPVCDQQKQAQQHYRLAATRKSSFVVIRYLGHSAQQARLALTEIWHVVRPALLARKTCEPRIWNT